MVLAFQILFLCNKHWIFFNSINHIKIHLFFELSIQITLQKSSWTQSNIQCTTILSTLPFPFSTPQLIVPKTISFAALDQRNPLAGWIFVGTGYVPTKYYNTIHVWFLKMNIRIYYLSTRYLLSSTYQKTLSELLGKGILPCLMVSIGWKI